jgi:hypothetical protein
VFNGADVEATLTGVISDLPTVMNEFFVRLVGPGLACDVKGSKFTSEIPVDQKGPVELVVQSVWHGTRYQLKYAEKKLYEQHADGGPIGMAEIDKRPAPDAWVTTRPKVRTECTDGETWMVVVSPPTAGSSAVEPRVLEIDAAKPGGCDPCVVGGWSMDIQSFEEYMETLSQGQNIDIAGTYTMNFGFGPPEGQLEYSDDRDIEISFPGTGSALAIRLDGSGSGTYSATGDRVSTNGYSDSGTASITGVPAGASSPFANSGDGGAPYTCEGDDLTIVVNGSPLYATRTPATERGPAYFG